VLLVLMLPVHALLFVIAWPATRRHRVGALVSLASFTLPYLPLVWWQWRLLTSPNFQPGFAFVPLGRMSAILLAALGRGIRPVPSLGFAAVWVFLILAALLLTWRGPWRRPLLVLLAWLLLPPLLLYVITLQVPLFNDRYLIFIAPAFYLLAAAGLVAVARRSRGLAIAAALIVVALQVYGIWGQVHTPIKADWRGVAAFVQATGNPNEIVLFQHPYNRFVYAYYAGWDYPWRETPFAPEAADMTVADVGARLEQLLEGARAVWLVESEVDAWDPRGLNRQWLESHGTPTADASFNLVRVTRYRLLGLVKKQLPAFTRPFPAFSRPNAGTYSLTSP
jgi:4-amino-4-deoxy-L-arabinose transferase-like glycosyltransferase